MCKERGKCRAGCRVKVKHFRHHRVVMTDLDRSRYTDHCTWCRPFPQGFLSFPRSLRQRFAMCCVIGNGNVLV